MSERFQAKKQDILDRLSRQGEDYEDASPKGSVDEGIKELVDEINRTPGFVTTSSCSGRIAVFREGPSKLATSVPDELNEDVPSSSRTGDDQIRRVGGKGGGRWFYTSHDRVDLQCLNEAGAIFHNLGFPSSTEISFPQDAEHPQYVHFKFEPMILHILTASAKHAQLALNAAMAAGFRESGISGLYDSKNQSSNPMVAVRSSGLALDSIVGFQSSSETLQIFPMVSEVYLQTLIQVANDRFEINAQRMKRFRLAFLEQVERLNGSPLDLNVKEVVFEPADVRKERKRREGLLIRDSLRTSTETSNSANDRQSEDMQDGTTESDLNFDLLSCRLQQITTELEATIESDSSSCNASTEGQPRELGERLLYNATLCLVLSGKDR